MHLQSALTLYRWWRYQRFLHTKHPSAILFRGNPDKLFVLDSATALHDIESYAFWFPGIWRKHECLRSIRYRSKVNRVAFEWVHCTAGELENQIWSRFSREASPNCSLPHLARVQWLLHTPTNFYPEQQGLHQCLRFFRIPRKFGMHQMDCWN